MITGISAINIHFSAKSRLSQKQKRTKQLAEKAKRRQIKQQPISALFSSMISAPSTVYNNERTGDAGTCTTSYFGREDASHFYMGELVSQVFPNGVKTFILGSGGPKMPLEYSMGIADDTNRSARERQHFFAEMPVKYPIYSFELDGQACDEHNAFQTSGRLDLTGSEWKHLKQTPVVKNALNALRTPTNNPYEIIMPPEVRASIGRVAKQDMFKGLERIANISKNTATPIVVIGTNSIGHHLPAIKINDKSGSFNQSKTRVSFEMEVAPANELSQKTIENLSQLAPGSLVGIGVIEYSGRLPIDLTTSGKFEALFLNAPGNPPSLSRLIKFPCDNNLAATTEVKLFPELPKLPMMFRRTNP